MIGLVGSVLKVLTYIYIYLLKIYLKAMRIIIIENWRVGKERRKEQVVFVGNEKRKKEEERERDKESVRPKGRWPQSILC